MHNVPLVYVPCIRNDRMETKYEVVGISGLAGSGKDTFFKLLSQRISIERFALADELKAAIRDELINDYDIDVIACSREEKEVVRGRLIEFGQKMRSESKGRHWVDILEKKMKPLANNACITDIRYDDYDKDEVHWLKNDMCGTLVHVSMYEQLDNVKIFGVPPNDEEARNDPKLKSKADFRVEWPKIKNLDKKAIYSKLSIYADNFLKWLDDRRKIKRQPVSLES